MVENIVISLPKSIILQNCYPYKNTNYGFNGGFLKGFYLELKPRSKRKDFNSLVVASSSNGSSSNGGGWFYFNVTGFPFPLGPFLNRSTVRTEVVKNIIWLFKQEQSLGFSNVFINTRMTVIKLKSGGLWIHAFIAPTK
ncbi:hypothetical protein GIB67_035381 [Kingdonia uniflora]|uniref:Uncharacterized protein n=1 Tax=Kingdonia uniflora TaxID=39325 RepID=A0A7J7MMJ3_9MAGN|nr:hypothetical protein GIB67_035381 [Kingdonia uniflora]